MPGEHQRNRRTRSALATSQQQIENLKSPLPLLRSRMPALRINYLERTRHRKTQPAGYSRQSRLDLVAIRKIDPRFRHRPLQYSAQPDIHVQRLESMNALLHPLGDRQIPRLNPNPAVRLRATLRHQQQVPHFLIDKIVIALDVLLVDVQARNHSKEMFNLLRALDVLVRLYVMHRLYGSQVFVSHFLDLYHLLVATRPRPTGIASSKNRSNLCLDFVELKLAKTLRKRGLPARRSSSAVCSLRSPATFSLIASTP